jgi:hypothetical protein
MTSYPQGTLRSGTIRVTREIRAQPGANPHAVVFSLGPSIAHENIIDYETPAGAKSYNIATAKLQEELFDCEPVGIAQFLCAIKNGSMQCGWPSILQFPKDIHNPTVNRIDMITKYRDITLAQVTAHAATDVDTKDSNAQNCCNHYLALVNFLTPAAMTKLKCGRMTAMSMTYHVGPSFSRS